MLHWLIHALGIDSKGYTYGFWSGFGSCLTEFTILGVVYRRIACHSKGCWRLGLHHVGGTPYVTCRRHHPTVPNRAVSTAHIHDAHRKALGTTASRGREAG